MLRCRNPSTLYIKGVEYFYTLQCHEEGLALMKRAADAGYLTKAVYLCNDSQTLPMMRNTSLVLREKQLVQLDGLLEWMMFRGCRSLARVLNKEVHVHVNRSTLVL
ncbi:hypothetical protein Bca52824_065097 [Brassica carinata]|uniref:Uncharacterized protein n=1 Tax=Brassica carinata TaxID=52824 RepID=A0A8X7U995_BRACI|nr:hypothetical protein Bca52824_065097 [Brassica carinata]